ncbi:MAG TPA: SpoIID/LytB domain-containing protein [Vicinamibacterales bacterium]
MRWLLLGLALAGAASLSFSRVGAEAPAEGTAGAAWRVVEWPGGAVVAESDGARLQTPVQPGSILKLPALIAALNAGIVTQGTRVPCRGEARVGGHVVRCSHPRQRHALGPSEALALSCNVWFATVGSRLPRGRFDAVLTALGLPPSPGDAPMPLAVTGLRATPVPPLALLEALRRVVTGAPGVELTDAARRIVMDGLRGAALYGTADAFADRGLDAAAKTGTADAPGGGVHGLVVAAWPATNPARGLVLMAAGAAGTNAAQLAAEIATAQRTRAVPTKADARSSPGASGNAATSRQTLLRVGTAQGRQYAVREYELEDYVARVVAGEAAPRSAPAALEALAIAVRTFALANRGRHARDGFDLCTLTHCQVLREPHEAARRAARATEGQVLVDRGVPVPVYFSASCGGRTERPSAVWPGADDPSWLPSRRDRACGGEPRWAAEIPVQDLERALRAAGFSRGRLLRLSIDGRSSSGRVLRLRLEGLVPDRITGQDFRMAVGRTLGWQLVKSTAFDLRRTGNGYRFDGRGFGHGVGMCVTGAARRAERGEAVQEILDAYYPGLRVMRMPAGASAPTTRIAPAPEPARQPQTPPVMQAAKTAPPARAAASGSNLRIVLPPTAESERAALTEYARRTLDALVRATGRQAPDRIDLVFHPSAASFQRETQEPWWSAARTRGTRVDLLPPAVLWARGTLESTLRHELAHVLTAPVLGDRPEWVREGVAMYFAGEPPPASLLGEDGRPRRVRCPSDDDLRRPPSPAVAREAYARAAACVAREIQGGTPWGEIR